MKQLIITGLALIFFGCGPSREEIEAREKGIGLWSNENVKTTQVAGQDFEVIKIDSCEYIYHYGNRSESLIHKANCKNH